MLMSPPDGLDLHPLGSLRQPLHIGDELVVADMDLEVIEEVRAALPEAEFVTRPRMSTLSYAGSKKINRLPPRSAVVAFTISDVYAIAEYITVLGNETRNIHRPGDNGA